MATKTRILSEIGDSIVKFMNHLQAQDAGRLDDADVGRWVARTQQLATAYTYVERGVTAPETHIEEGESALDADIEEGESAPKRAF